MVDMTLDEAELARRFAEETDAIAGRGAAPDCAEQLQAFHVWFDAECTRMQAAARADDPAQETEAARR